MPIEHGGAVIYEIGKFKFRVDIYSRPPKDDIGTMVSNFSRGSSQNAVQAATETRISKPNTGVVIGEYDPVVSALLSREIG